MKHMMTPATLAFLLALASEASAQASMLGPGSRDLFEEPLLLRQDQDRGRGRRDQVEFIIPRGTARIFLGWKALEEHDWEPVETQGEFAILTDFGLAEWPVRLAVDLRLAAEEERVLGLHASSFSWELNLGVRQVFETGSPVRPYFGGGVSFGGASLDDDIDSDSDAGVGLWIDFGVDLDLGGPICVGLELCFSLIPVEIAGVDTNAGGFHIGITVGYSW